MGRGTKTFVYYKIYFSKNVPGVLKRQKIIIGGGGGAGEKNVFHYKFYFLKNVPGVLKRKKKR